MVECVKSYIKKNHNARFIKGFTRKAFPAFAAFRKAPAAHREKNRKIEV
jgi:mannose-6-phosphate isomerase class I